MMVKPIVHLMPTLVHVEGKPIGRHRLVNWHQVAKLIRVDWSVRIETVAHDTNLSTCLVQTIGSCTGDATAHCKCSKPYDGVLTQADAEECYSLATKDDNFQGQWPPIDTGSTGYFAMQAAVELGWFKGFAMCIGLTPVLQQLQSRAGITGIDWYEGFDNPDVAGRVRPTGRIRGGHEVCIAGCDITNRLVWFQNSWDPKEYGVRYANRDGCFCMSFDDYELMLASGGDATFPDVP